jgi:ribosomal protein S18 acetylase RimI-like enzyme
MDPPKFWLDKFFSLVYWISWEGEMSPLEYLKIRPLRIEDLEAIVAIDENVLGEKRRDYWEKKLQMMDDKASQVSLVAEVQGKVLGFILGDISGWEFGVPDTIGWIDTIGVDPAHQKKGLATALAQELIRRLKAIGVRTIYTLVSWNDWELLQFFHAMGFTRGDMINLELKV